MYPRVLQQSLPHEEVEADSVRYVPAEIDLRSRVVHLSEWDWRGWVVHVAGELISGRRGGA